jgi:predicted Holliday junction resolvase-like endonuclease
MLCLLDRLPWFSELCDQISSLKIKAESCSRQLKAWMQSLQNSDYKGERYVTEKIKQSDQATREREEFLKELVEIRKKDAASRN